MNKFDKEFWTNRYLSNETGWDVGSITAPLKEYIDQLKDKTISILIPGAGNSYEAEYLHNEGFKNVTVIDISEEPIKNIKKRLPDFPKDKLIQCDFFEHHSNYDLILEQTFFCALDPSLRSKYIEKMAELLKPNGKLAGLVFIDPVDTDHPPFGAAREEYIHLFEKKFDIKTLVPCINSIKPRAGRELFMILQKK